MGERLRGKLQRKAVGRVPRVESFNALLKAKVLVE